MEQVERLQRFSRDRSTYVTVMIWKGDKIPQGATIDGVPITWTQNGQITCTAEGRRKDAGNYVRNSEYGGAGRDEHTMTMYFNSAVKVINPNGDECLVVRTQATKS